MRRDTCAQANSCSELHSSVHRPIHVQSYNHLCARGCLLPGSCKLVGLSEILQVFSMADCVGFCIHCLFIEIEI